MVIVEGSDSSNLVVDTRTEELSKDMRHLEDLLSKLNPMAEEFVPPSLVNGAGSGGIYPNNFLNHGVFGNGEFGGNGRRMRKSGYGEGRRRMNNRTSAAQREEVIRRTVHVSDIDQQVCAET